MRSLAALWRVPCPAGLGSVKFHHRSDSGHGLREWSATGTGRITDEGSCSPPGRYLHCATEVRAWAWLWKGCCRDSQGGISPVCVVSRGCFARVLLSVPFVSGRHGSPDAAALTVRTVREWAPDMGRAKGRAGYSCHLAHRLPECLWTGAAVHVLGGGLLCVRRSGDHAMTRSGRNATMDRQQRNQRTMAGIARHAGHVCAWPGICHCQTG